MSFAWAGMYACVYAHTDGQVKKPKARSQARSIGGAEV